MNTGRAERRTLVLAAGLLLLSARIDAADRQLRPFMGATFGGGTTFVDPDNAIGNPKLAIGVGCGSC